MRPWHGSCSSRTNGSTQRSNSVRAGSLGDRAAIARNRRSSSSPPGSLRRALESGQTSTRSRRH